MYTIPNCPIHPIPMNLLGFPGLFWSLHPTLSHVRYWIPPSLNSKIPATESICQMPSSKLTPPHSPPHPPLGTGVGSVGGGLETDSHDPRNLSASCPLKWRQENGGGGGRSPPLTFPCKNHSSTTNKTFLNKFPWPHPCCNAVVTACRLSGP